MRFRLLVPLTALLVSAVPLFANPALEGIANYAAYSERVQKLDASDLVAVTSLGKTLGGREIHLLTIGRGEPTKKPAIGLMGNVRASHVVGSEIALRIAEKIVAQADAEPYKKLLDEITIYVIPRPDPDATEKNFVAPYRAIDGNGRKTDDDRDGRFGEDAPDDLNGDGWITMMRVESEAGRWISHPEEPGVLIEIDRRKNEQGKYEVYVEGRDDDHDEQFNEDGGDGVALHRNWPHRYEPFQPGTGPNAVSEMESRIIADFLYDRTNVFALLTISADDNLFQTWKPDESKEKQPIRTTVQSGDAPYFDHLAEKFRDLHGGKNPPEVKLAGGSFLEWSYFQYGRWTFASRGGWSAAVEEKPAEKPKGENEKDKQEAEKKSPPEKRGSDDVATLRRYKRENIPGFVEWTPVEHPDFPGKKVEVGGFKPFYRDLPPAKEFEDLAEKHAKFLSLMAESRARPTIGDVRVEPLGSNLYRITATIVNRGYLPTVPAMGETAESHQHLQLQLSPPEKTVFLKGPPRVKLGRLEHSSKQEIVWLIRLPSPPPAKAGLRLWSPESGESVSEIELK